MSEIDTYDLKTLKNILKLSKANFINIYEYRVKKLRVDCGHHVLEGFKNLSTSHYFECATIQYNNKTYYRHQTIITVHSYYIV